jgi:hypothetical protein
VPLSQLFIVTQPIRRDPPRLVFGEQLGDRLFYSRIDSEPENQILRETAIDSQATQSIASAELGRGDGLESPPESFFSGTELIGS